MAIDANNLRSVAVKVRQHWPDALCMLFADDDRLTPGNPGISKAREAAIAAGIEASRSTDHALHRIQLERGALTTSGDARRYLLKGGMRYGHVLNPKTGWPVEGAPASVTVAGNNCTEAGILSTLAILHGRDAESFLDEQDVKYWIQR